MSRLRRCPSGEAGPGEDTRSWPRFQSAGADAAFVGCEPDERPGPVSESFPDPE